MDPLSAMKLTMTPDMGVNLKGIMQDATAKAIPMQELDKLSAGSAAGAALPSTTATGDGGSFQNLLGNFVGEVNSQQLAAGDAMSGLMSGKNVSLHQAMISMEEASVSFQMMVEVRNKLLDSYQELMRMQV